MSNNYYATQAYCYALMQKYGTTKDEWRRTLAMNRVARKLVDGWLEDTYRQRIDKQCMYFDMDMLDKQIQRYIDTPDPLSKKIKNWWKRLWK